MVTYKSKGWDFADFLTRFDYRKFLVLEKLSEPLKVLKNAVNPPRKHVENKTPDKDNKNKNCSFTP